MTKDKGQIAAINGPRFITRSQVAYMMGLSTSQITTLTKRAKDPLPIAFKETKKTGAPVFYDLRAVMQWQLDETCGQRSSGGKAHDLNLERARLAREQTESVSLKNQVARGEYIRKDILETALSKIVGIIVSALDSVPGILKKRCNTSTKELTQVKKVLNRLRADLAEIQLTDV